MKKESSFMKACKSLEKSKNFQEISEISLENAGERGGSFDLEKFKQGSRETAKWLGQMYGWRGSKE